MFFERTSKPYRATIPEQGDELVQPSQQEFQSFISSIIYLVIFAGKQVP